MENLSASSLGRVILLTGAAGTGKSTLARLASESIPRVQRVDFGQMLLNLKVSQGHLGLTYEELRAKSAQIVTRADVRDVDRHLIACLEEMRGAGHVLIDSHAVTQESYGYRITHYSKDELAKIRFDAVVGLYCSPEILVARRMADPKGRPTLSHFQAMHHMALQEAVAINYAILCGCPCFFYDSGSHEPTSLALLLRRVLEGIELS